VSDGYYSSEGSMYNRSSQASCPPGYYCINGARIACPSGRYGQNSQSASPDCSGVCESGYYCPAGSISSTQFWCGSPAVYCPAGSGSSVSVAIGNFSSGGKKHLENMHACCVWMVLCGRLQGPRVFEFVVVGVMVVVMHNFM
jgi:hypothetical protein